MARIMVRPCTEKTRPVIEEYVVTYVDPESGVTLEFEILCQRGHVFTALRLYLAANGCDSSLFDIETSVWTRERIGVYR